MRLGTSFVNITRIPWKTAPSYGGGPTGELSLDLCQWNFTALPLFLDSPIPQPRRKDVYAGVFYSLREPSVVVATPRPWGHTQFADPLQAASDGRSRLSVLRLRESI